MAEKEDQYSNGKDKKKHGNGGSNHFQRRSPLEQFLALGPFAFAKKVELHFKQIRIGSFVLEPQGQPRFVGRTEYFRRLSRGAGEAGAFLPEGSRFQRPKSEQSVAASHLFQSSPEQRPQCVRQAKISEGFRMNSSVRALYLQTDGADDAAIGAFDDLKICKLFFQFRRRQPGLGPKRF